MAANYGLLTETAKVPMSGHPFQMNTPVENQAIRYGMEGKKLAVEAGQQTFDRGNQDREIVKAALARDENDLATPEGGDSLLKTIKGSVSPEMYSGMADHVEKIKSTHAKNQDLLLNMPGEVLDLQTKQWNALAPAIDQGLKSYAKNKSEKGEVYAAEEQRKFMGELFTHTRGMKMPNGQPLYPPEIINSLKDMGTEQMDSVLRGTKYMGDQTKRAHDEATTRRQEAEAKILSDGGKSWDELQAPDGTLYRVSKLNGQILKQDPTSGSLNPVSALPADVKKLGASTPAKKPDIMVDGDGNKWSVVSDSTVLKNGSEVLPLRSMPNDVKKLAAKGAGEKQTAMGEDTLQFLADYASRTGKSFPVPALGIGNTNGRTMYLTAAAGLAKDRGYDGSEAGDLALQRDAAKAANSNLQKQNAIIQVGEQDLIGVMRAMREELKKIGGPDSPVIRKLWNTASTEWAGDPQFKGFNAAYANFLDVSAKVLSGQSGAGGTPVSYLELAKKQLGDNPNLSQVAEVDKMMTKLFSIRQKAVETTSESLRKASEMTPKTGSPAASRVQLGEQKDRDSESTRIMRSEYAREMERSKDPAKRDDALRNLDGIRKELKKNGVTDLPDPGSSSVAPAKTKSGATVSNW